MASLISVVVAVGCGGSSSKPDGGSGTAGSSGGSTGTGTAGSSGGSTGTGTAGSSGGSTGTGGAGGTGSGSCGNVEPCGGSLVGTWNVTSECINSMVLAPETQAICATATLTDVSITPSGSLTFGADMTYTLSGSTTVVLKWNVPASCLAGETCDYFASMFQDQLPAGATFTCTGSTSCICTEAALAPNDDHGTYGTTGSNVVVTSAVSSQTTTTGYCVQGSTLHIVTVDATMNGGPMGAATINKDVVAAKQ
jgi:hypothetical protein